MCSYCGCESEQLVAELMADHERMATLAQQANAALDQGDAGRATELCALIAGLFDVHGAKEEDGLFAELRGEELAVESVARLEAEHRELEVGLAILAAGDLSALGRVLGRLVDHAGREDTDLFPAALMLLSNEAWLRVNKVHRGAGPT